MDTVDITPTPEACRQIAHLFRAQQTHSEEMAARARDALDGLDDGEIGPWDRALLAAAFAALGDGERARVTHMREGLDALGPYATENGQEDLRDAPQPHR
jgi:hypothetical protein